MAPEVTPTVASPQLVLTLDNYGQTITLEPGQRFLLSLGDAYEWTVTVADPAIVGLVLDAPVVPGSQGLFEARQPGTTILAAGGDPPCRKNKPPCGAPSRDFQVTLVVE